MTIKEKVKATIAVSKLAAQFNKDKDIKEQITNFEDNIEKKLCDTCRKKFPLFKHRLNHVVSQSRVFCKPCNKLIAKAWSDLFVRATEKTKKV